MIFYLLTILAFFFKLKGFFFYKRKSIGLIKDTKKIISEVKVLAVTKGATIACFFAQESNIFKRLIQTYVFRGKGWLVSKDTCVI